MNLVEMIMTNNPCYTAGRKITVKGLMLHSVGCPQPSAMVFIRNWNKSSYKNACVHGFIDANDGTAYQTLPWNHRGWHGGGSSNNTHIGVEMCEPACIKYTGGSSFVCSDLVAARACAKRTYDTAVELFAYLCKMFNLNPLGDGVIVSHKEGCARGIASNHGDPEHLWKGLGMSYTMDTFRNDVYEAMNGKFEWTEQTVNLIGTINVSSTLNIRTKPVVGATIIGKHANGDVVTIVAKTNNGWYRVEYPTLGTGYISADYVSVKENIVTQQPYIPEEIPEVEEKAEKDNTPDEWAKVAVENAMNNGILYGDDTGDLKLHKNCTRQEMIVFLYRLYKFVNK